MAINQQFFTKGIDFTALGAIAAAADHNNLVDLARPYTDKGLTIKSTDTALGVPDVPDANNNTIFKTCLWIRLPHASDPETKATVYAWCDNLAAPDITLLNWVDIATSLTSLSAQLTAVNTLATTAKAVADAANTVAGTSYTYATDAKNSATTAAANAATAVANAATAVTTANTAEADAQTAITTANAATASVNSKRDINTILTPPGTAGQIIKSTASGFVYVNEKDLYAKFSETQALGTNGGTSSTGENIRILATTDTNTGNIVTLDPATGKFTINTAGDYYFRGRGVMANDGAYTHQLMLQDVALGSKLIKGTPMYVSTAYVDNSVSTIEGMLTCTAGQVLKLSHYASNGSSGTAGKGHAASRDTEVYAVLEVWKLS